MTNNLFEKVPFDQFLKDVKSVQTPGSLWFENDDKIIEVYADIQLPRRATAGSAGYDFFMPFPAVFTSMTPVLIPTGIRALMDPGQFLLCVPRSGLGFKYGMRLRNSLAVIDEDYCNAANHGHIMAKIITDEPFVLESGDRFMQGIFLPYATTRDDCPISPFRSGGMGSTGGVS